MTTKKLLDKNNPENTIVHIFFRGTFNEDYECVGVLIKENKDSIRVAFSAKDDKVVDFIDIRQSNIVSLNILDPLEIKKL